jgi:hypothetical protein
MFTKEEILNASDLQTHDGVVPDSWGGFVRIRELTAHDRAEYFKAMKKAVDDKGQIKDHSVIPHLEALMVLKSVITEAGEQMFSDNDLDALKGKNGAVLKKIAEEALELNGMTDGALEQAEGNFEPSRDSSSSTR